MHQVAVVKAKGERNEAIAQAINLLGGIEHFVNKGEIVAIKPNLCNFRYRYPVTSSVEAASFIIDLIKPLTQEIVVIESPSASMNPELKYAALGYDKLDGVRLINLNKDRLVKGKDFDKLINLCNLKTSEISTISCGLKNIFGCYPQRNKAKLHPQIAHAIVSINQQYPSDLVVVDALIGMEGQGPLFGVPIKMDLMLAGDNVVATDYAACRIMEVDSSEVEHLTLADNSGLGSTRNVKFIGENIESVKRKFRRSNPEPFVRKIKHFISSYELPSRILAKIRESF